MAALPAGLQNLIFDFGQNIEKMALLASLQSFTIGEIAREPAEFHNWREHGEGGPTYQVAELPL